MPMFCALGLRLGCVHTNIADLLFKTSKQRRPPVRAFRLQDRTCHQRSLKGGEEGATAEYTETVLAAVPDPVSRTAKRNRR